MSLINNILKVFVGDKSKRDIKAIQPYVDKIKENQKLYEQLSNDDLRAKTIEFKERIKEARAEQDKKIASYREELKNLSDIDKREEIFTSIDELEKQAYEVSEKALNGILPEAFAVIKETARRFTENKELVVTATEQDRRIAEIKNNVTIDGDKAIWSNTWEVAGNLVTWNMVHYDVQMIGGTVIHQGKIAEMQTGEGKTLVSTSPIYLNALTGKGVHVVTVNDYLAKRDCQWNAPIFEFHGLTVDCIDNHQPNSPARRAAYQADITFGTNNEFGFDYLRDNMVHSPEELVQRPHNYAIIDEVDSVLIDEARTPLIISGPVPQGDKHEFKELKPIVENLIQEQRKLANNFLTTAKKLIRAGEVKEGGFNLLRSHRALPKNKALIKFLSEEGVKQILQKTENHFMQDNSREMKKVDEALLFVINEKNNQVELTDNGIKLLSEGAEDNFFILPDIGIEIANIENKNLPQEEIIELKEKLFQDFGIKSERIHTLTQLLKAYALFEKNSEYVVIDNKVMIVDEQTGRIMDGRRYSDGLHQAIEAKENVKIEAATQTFATITLQNYFRMYNKLSGMTGTAVTEAGEFWEIYKLDVVEIPTNKPIAREDKHDLVYHSIREKFNAVIEDVVELSKAGRPVLIGTTSVDNSELLSRMLKMRGIKHNVLNAKLHKREADIVAEAGNPGVVTIATNMAGRGTDIKLTDEVKQAGGLAIIGTERHDSRRVDRQLRGRAGRQGDVGSSQFYVSLEDHLMRLFGSEKIARVMDRIGHEEGEVIQSSWMTKSIETAQKRVEENNFGVRKRLLEYDDVMNSQREVVYKRRKHALHGDRLKVDIANVFFDVCDLIAEGNKVGSDYNNFKFDVIKIFGVDTPVTEKEFLENSADNLTDILFERIYNAYLDKNEKVAGEAFQVVKEFHENPESKYEHIMIPLTDGSKVMNVRVSIEEVYNSEGKLVVDDFEKSVTLSIIDEAWKKHLRKMDELKQSVQLAVHEQKDPLIVYKFEAFELFKTTMQSINKDIVSYLMKADLPKQQQETAPPKQTITSSENGGSIKAKIKF